MARRRAARTARVCASAVKYDRLTALMLHRASDERQLDHGGTRTVPAEHRYRERGAAPAFLAGWAEEARRRHRNSGSACLVGPGGVSRRTPSPASPSPRP
ncbi:hypothetical protein N8I84_30835 [Streptomyces cynarae]|uniref:Uncharacterized protein n=1 Tax=Streptomyces cynarae TaxID=2981134 RepID=A0ABY6E7H2_9ACTN|nr:hypothetical protein [Streptomyces cynarae]UXY22614.1 hypothetical protein N8I84_30835 [Streptomyces cynarae]